MAREIDPIEDSVETPVVDVTEVVDTKVLDADTIPTTDQVVDVTDVPEVYAKVDPPMKSTERMQAVLASESPAVLTSADEQAAFLSGELPLPDFYNEVNYDGMQHDVN